jgi:hypothetical protein
VIVIGVMGVKQPADSPTPVFIGDSPASVRKVQVLGKTVVRWVYPLDAAPVQPAAGAMPVPEEGPTPEGGPG